MVPKCLSPLPEVFVRGYPLTQYLVKRQDNGEEFDHAQCHRLIE